MNNISKLSFQNVDAYIFAKGYHRKYFSGFSSSFGFLIITKNKSVYITDKRYEKAGKDHFAKSDITLEISQNLSEVLAKYSSCFENPAKAVIGFEEELTVGEFRSIKDSFVEIGVSNFENISPEIHSLRSVKSDEEIAKISHAMQISAKAFEEFLKTVKVGQTERELCANLNHQIYLQGADTLAFETIVASGENGAKPHATPSNRKVQKGDFVTCDFGGCVDGYNADITRTFAIGEVSQKQKEVYDLVRHVQETCLLQVCENKNTADIHNTAVAMFQNAGYGEYFTHGLGHGVGVEIHESPTLNPRSTEVLKENMVVTVEPGIYIENQFGLRIEDTIVVKKDGICNLNPLSKELIVII